MDPNRWLSAVARWLVRIMLFVPIGALVLATLVDQGPSGNARVSIFSAAVMVFDPFTWTCVRNSLIFAAAITAISLIMGLCLGWVVGKRRLRGRAIVRGAIATMMATAPAFLALGLVGLLGPPRAWPWPMRTGIDWGEDASLESWRGIPVWSVWVWSTLPAAIAHVTLVIALAAERLDPAWEDGGRLAGVGPFRAWRTLCWPLLRRPAASALAVVFAVALVEPGGPLVMGLRRTIAFQIVSSARQSDVFPRAAIWALIAALIAFLGGTLIMRWGGDARADGGALDRGTDRGPASRPARASLAREIAAAWIVATILVAAWLPAVGLVRLAIGRGWESSAAGAGVWQRVTALVDRLDTPGVRELAANSLMLGATVGVGIVAIVWLARDRLIVASIPGRATWGGQPLVTGIGILAIPWLASIAAKSLGARDPSSHAAAWFEAFGRLTSLERNSWTLLAASVGVSLLAEGQRAASPSGRRIAAVADGAYRAALLAGSSPGRARALCRPWPLRRGLGLMLAVGALAATNIAPAVLFTPWADGRTIGPGVLALAGGDALARSQSAALALCALAVNLAGLAAVQFTLAPPPPRL